MHAMLSMSVMTILDRGEMGLGFSAGAGEGGAAAGVERRLKDGKEDFRLCAEAVAVAGGERGGGCGDADVEEDL
jgi:hypothetical protein